MVKDYSEKEFGWNKAKLEADKLALVCNKGGWFGLTHKNFMNHYQGYNKHMRSKSPFVAIERDLNTFLLMQKDAKGLADRRFIKLIQGDLFEDLFKAYPPYGYHTNQRDAHGKVKKRIPLFNYGHLDFCCTAAMLTEEGLEKFLRRLAKWWALKRTFHLDITVSKRGDRDNNSSTVLLDYFIPNAFKQLGWRMTYAAAVDYFDTNVMITAFYIFTKQYSISSARG